MSDLGYFALALGLFLSGYAVLVDIFGAWRKDSASLTSGRNATIASLLCLTVAMAALWTLLVRSDFSVSYVFEHTAKDLPLTYKISALWAGAAGSLLLWLWLQVGFVVFVFCRHQPNQRNFAAGARIIANLVSVFFLFVLIFDKNPFALSTAVPSDGSGLNPLLQHPAMALHPPTLFIGFAAFVIPFAWTFASLKHNGAGQTPPFFRQTRNWILWAWTFLTIGIVLGAWWAYEELGWGGYWAWDPVENASLLPWLIATALLHCSRTYNPRNSIATWLEVLSLVTFSLCIFGTFLTRYGLVSSVHAFPDPGLGILFIVLLAHIWVIAAVLFLVLFIKHKKNPKSDTAGRGHIFIVIFNGLMALLTFIILFGTLYPFLSSLVTKEQITWTPETFTKITAPGGLALLLLLAVCPHLLRHGFNKSWRTIGAILAVVIALTAWVFTRKLAPSCFVLCGFAALSLIGDFLGRFFQNKRKNERQTPTILNLRWWGARIVHIGVVMAFIGIAGSDGYDVEELAALKPGDGFKVAKFDITFDKLKVEDGPNYTEVIAEISVYKGQKLLAKLNPSRAFYTSSDKPTTEVDVRRTLASDLYAALLNVDTRSELINLKVLIKPLINWIWIGSITSMLGVGLVLISFYRRKTTVAKG